jgi:hypothetical protein
VGVVVVFISTVVVWFGAVTRFPWWLTRMAAVTGFLGIGIVAIFGLLRAFSHAKDVIE